MAKLDRGSFDNHRDCNVGDTIIAKDTDGNEYHGTVVKNPGATVYVQSNTGRMLEFRRLKDADTGELAILLGMDGKEVTNNEKETGVNAQGRPITKESSTLSFDKEIVDFEAEHQQHTLG